MMHMNSALFHKAINDSKLLFAAVFVLMFGFPLVFLWASGMISLPAFSEFLTNALPRSWQRVWGVPISQVATPAGRAALVFVHPLVMSSGVVWAITRGSDCVSGEIGRGTMEMLLAQPVRRVSVYASQAIVTVAGSMLLAAGAWCGTAIGLRLSTMYAGVSAGLYVAPAINLFGLMVCDRRDRDGRLCGFHRAFGDRQYQRSLELGELCVVRERVQAADDGGGV
jgi:hypothetical protein